MSDPDPFVCDACGSADCWNGILYCDDHWKAGIIRLSEYQPEVPQ